MTYYDSVIENNSKSYLKSVNIKYPGNIKKQGNSTIFGKGIREATNLYYVRLYQANRLTERKEFIKGNLSIIMLKNMKEEWKKIGEGFSCKFLSANNDLVSNDNMTRSKITSDKIKEVLEIHR